MSFEQTTATDVLFLSAETTHGPLSVTEDGHYHWVWWRPSWHSFCAPSLPRFVAMVWWAFHGLRIFRSKEFGVLYLRVEGVIVHRSVVFPKYFRFPFMDDSDLQIGDTWTHPDQRGRQLARRALGHIIARYAGERRRFWYLTEAENIPSVKAAVAAGFRVVGRGKRKKRWGLSFLGYFELCRSLSRETSIPTYE